MQLSSATCGSEAARIKIAASNEIPIGVYYVQSGDKNWVSQLRIHLLVQPERRIASKAIIERHRWLIHEVVEERLRQIDPSLLQDVVLLEIKEQIKNAVEDALQEQVIDRVLVNDRVEIPIQRFQMPPAYELTAPEAIFTSTQAATDDKAESEVAP